MASIVQTFVHRAACGKPKWTLGSSILFAALSFMCAPAWALNDEPITVTYVDASDLKRNPNNVYFGALLKLALDKSVSRYGQYALNPIDIEISQKRHLRELDNGTISVFWTMTSYAREVDMLPVRVPLTKGMYGIRLFAINSADKDAFAALTTPKMLATWSALLGRDWPDTAIMRVNRFNVRSDVAETELYSVLDKYRGNYFPRAVTEIFSELDSRPELKVIADEHMGLVYPAAVYFFVAKNNPQLAERLQFGLEQAQQDGSFDELFYEFPTHKAAFERAQFAKRKLIYIENPLLPQSTNAQAIKQMQQAVIDKFSH